MIDLRTLRRDYQLSQNDLADLLGCGQSFVSQVENGNDPMPSEWIEKLAEKLNISDVSKYITCNITNTELRGNNGDFMRQLLSVVADIKKTYDEQLQFSNEHISRLTTIIEKLAAK